MKKKISKLQKKKDNPFSGYWLRKCDSLFRQQIHKYWIENNLHYCWIGSINQIKSDGIFDPCKGKIECCHLIPIQNYLIRWERLNVIPACSWHHKYSRIISIHNSPIVFGIWLRDHYPGIALWIDEHRNVITRKIELPWTFKEKYEELCKIS